MRNIYMNFLIVVAFIISINNAFAFGANGHRIVAVVAEQYLSANAKKAILKITKGTSLAKLATWPDEIRSDRNWRHAKPWHFLSIDDNESFEGLRRNKKGDVLEALPRFEKKLKDKGVVGEERWQALAFYVHLMGDIHQPLHVGRRDDRGGNNIEVNWFDNESNLHSVWDSGLIDTQELSYSEYARFIESVTPAQKNEWQSTDYLDYAKESKNLRLKVYDFGEDAGTPPELGYQYSSLKIAIINQRLVQAGIRLAGRLNAIFP